jgi:hypothetical protein
LVAKRERIGGKEARHLFFFNAAVLMELLKGRVMGRVGTRLAYISASNNIAQDNTLEIIRRKVGSRFAGEEEGDP